MIINYHKAYEMAPSMYTNEIPKVYPVNATNAPKKEKPVRKVEFLKNNEKGKVLDFYA